MVVREIMQKDVATCPPHEDVATAARIMRDRKCGFLPVVDSHGVVSGVVTDRDLCLALAVETHRPPERMAVTEAMSRPVFSCFPDENVKAVLATMAKHHVRRLTVLDREGRLQGVLSIDDIVQAPRRRGAPTAEEIVEGVRGIGAPRHVEAVGA